MSTTNNLLETINSTVLAGEYTTYTPESWSTTSTSAISSSPVLSSSTIPFTGAFEPVTISIDSNGICSRIDNTKEEMTKELEKVYQHVDELEEDIEFLNEKREKLEQDLDELRAHHFKTVSDFTKKIDKLETDNANLITKLLTLESVLDDCVSKLR